MIVTLLNTPHDGESLLYETGVHYFVPYVRVAFKQNVDAVPRDVPRDGATCITSTHQSVETFYYSHDAGGVPVYIRSKDHE